MTGMMAYLVLGMLGVMTLGGTIFAFAGIGAEKTKKRVAAVARPNVSGRALKGGADANQQRRKNVQVMLKELEKQHAQKKKRPSLRRRIEQAGLTITPRTYWIASAISGVIAAFGAVASGAPMYAAPLAGFAFAI